MSTVHMQTGSVEMFCFLVFLWAHLDEGAAMRPGRSRGKVEGGRAGEKDVADSGDTVPLSPLAFNNSTEAWDPAWPLV